jgi:hypothetical protein
MQPRVVVVRRYSPYEELLRTHCTHGQAAFFLESRDQDIALVVAQHEVLERALAAVQAAIPSSWRRTLLLRGDLDRFLFEPEDIVVAVGQDGLVANVAKYLEGQPVLGINPDPERYDGVLVPFAPGCAGELLPRIARGEMELERRTMVEARSDDGQRLLALNEIFVGHRGHQSARYLLRHGDRRERHSSSGLIVSTGTGATGWARSIHRCHRSELALPTPTAPQLVFFVREAFPSRTTGCAITEGVLGRRGSLELRSEMEQGGVVFGDGIEDDRIELGWGRRLVVCRARRTLDLVRAS